MIYTIKQGDTLYDIARMYSTTIDELVRLNGLTRPDDLAVGQNIFVPTNTRTSTYTVVSGDTMYRIANKLGVSLDELIRANPQISNPNIIQIGQVINIPGSQKPSIEVNGYAIAGIPIDTLEQTLPYLTYLSLFSYQVLPNGNLTQLYEQERINTALNQNVSPVMVVTNIGESGGFSSELGSTILNNPNVQSMLINNIISTLNAKNYQGVDIDFEYLYPQDKDAYTQFLANLKASLPAGKTLSVAVAPKYRDEQEGLLYEAHDYRAIGEIADRVIIMTYEWGYVYGEPMAISPLKEVEAVISYAATRIPSNKILMGMPNYAYDWKTPWKEGDVANTITNTRALEIALENRVGIEFDSSAQAPYFTYIDKQGNSRIVWFEDARSIDARLDLVTKYELAGVSYWTINNFFPVNWAVLSNKFNIVKLS